MRKILSFALVFSLILAMMACGQDNNEENDMIGSVEITQAVVTETTPTDESMESVEETAVSGRRSGRRLRKES